MSVALAIDVSWNDANPVMKLTAKHAPAGNVITYRRQREAATHHVGERHRDRGAEAPTRHSTIVGTDASIPLTNRGPNPHANTAVATANQPGACWRVVLHRHGCRCEASVKRPRQDSNLRTRLRRPMLYPLSYEGEPTRLPGGPARPPGRRCAS